MVLKYTLDCEDKVQQIPNFCTFHRVSALLPKPAGAHVHNPNPIPNDNSGLITIKTWYEHETKKNGYQSKTLQNDKVVEKDETK